MMDDSTTFSCWGSANEDIIKSQFPLHRACRDGDVETLSLLLMEAQHGVYVEDSFYGWTPAHWAAHFGKLACLKHLQVSGINCDAATIRLNQTPAHIAALSSRPDCLRWLLGCAAAALDRQLACLRKLTMVGVACDGCSSRFQQTPAHMAAFGGQPHVLQWLLQARVGLDKQDYLGETALHKAARSGSIECVSLLVANGAHLRLCNNGGLDAARLAESCGHEACGQFLHSAVAQKEHSLTNGTAISQPRNTTETENGDCEMEVTESDRVVTNGYGGIGDVTLTCDISASITRMAGRKRAWDCGGMVECKRMRRTDSTPFSVAVNGFNCGNDLPTINGCGDGLRVQNGLHYKDVPRVENGLNGGHSTWGAVGGAGDALTTSALEHEDSVLIQLGYDALCCNVMLSNYHGS